MMYPAPDSNLVKTRELDPAVIVDKVGLLSQRIAERFPQRNLRRLCEELHVIAQDTQGHLDRLARPNWWLRAFFGVLLLLFTLGMLLALSNLIVVEEELTLTEFLGAVEAGINDLVLLGAATFFLLTYDNRLHRRRILSHLAELRALAHVVDMHQLTKDPARLLVSGTTTPSSPRENLTPFEMQRYLDYCSEMLSLIGKLAALYVQNVDDGVVIATVNEIEDLSSGISRKIWQKIMIIHSYDDVHSAISEGATASQLFPSISLDDVDGPEPPPA